MAQSLVQTYGRHSFDRFGDDLTELILSYLPLKDKLRFECVSKQWKQLIFNKQCLTDEEFILLATGIKASIGSIKRNKLLKTRLSGLTKKCPQILTINCRNHTISRDWVLVLIDIQSRLRVESIVFNCKTNRHNIERFFEKFGTNIKLIGFNIRTKSFVDTISQFYRRPLSLCPNVKSLASNSNQMLNILTQQFSPKLENLLEFNLIYNSNIFNDFLDKYYEQIKSIDITIGWPNFIQVHRLSNLNYLKLRLVNPQLGCLEESLKRIGSNCRNLKRISLNVDKTNIVGKHWVDLWHVMVGLKDLQQLILVSPNLSVYLYGQQRIPLMKFTKLLINCKYVSEGFFDKMVEMAPNLKVLDVSTEHNLPNNSLEFLSQFKRLGETRLKPLILDITDPNLINIINNCQTLKILNINQINFKSKIL